MIERAGATGRTKSLADATRQFKRILKQKYPQGLRGSDWFEEGPMRLQSSFESSVINILARTKQGREVIERNNYRLGDVLSSLMNDEWARKNGYRPNAGLTRELIDRQVRLTKRNNRR